MTKVFVGMSGGVDSSVTASLLAKTDYDISGIYMKNWSKNLPGTECPWADDLADAKRIAVKLGIDFQVYDFEKDYKQKVVDYMLREYKEGRTPNPDIMCNQEIKFNLFLKTALENGADMIATGHYAHTENGKLYKAIDQSKDQTYFLYRVTKKALLKTIFPLGKIKKTEVRKIASEQNLITANKKDSQGICFVGQVGIEEFLQQYFPINPGKIIDRKTNKQVGSHKGAIFYTIGQRHGLDVGGGLPYYVINKDIKNNIVFVSRDLNQTELWSDKIWLKFPHWIDKVPPINQYYQIRTRHLGALITAKIIKREEESVLIKLPEKQKIVASGQSVVFYDKDECLGGGIVA